MSQEPQLASNGNLNILTFRLNEVEKNLERGIKDLSEKVDKILDKISKSGYDSLDDDEKEYLFKQGGKK